MSTFRIGFVVGILPAVFLFIPSHGPAQCIPSPPGMVAWWAGQNNAKDSIGTNHGTLVGGITFATGTVASAFDLNGSDAYVQIPASTSLNTLTALTMDAWILPASGTKPIIEYSTPTAFGAHLWIHTDNDVFANFVDTGGGYHILKAGFAMTLNQWHHVAATYDKTSGIGAIYLDGEEILSLVLGSFNLATGSDVYLGHRPLPQEPPPNKFFDGLIDEAHIFNRALTPQEIEAIYDAANSGVCGRAPTTATWKLNPPDNNWNNPGNWSGGIVPNLAGDKASFGVSNKTNITIPYPMELSSITFKPGASAYTISCSNGPNGGGITFSGTGVTNSSGQIQNLSSDGNTLAFTNAASAGNLMSYTMNGGMVSGEEGGTLTFAQTSTTASATLIANAGTNGGLPGVISFDDSSNAVTARIVLNGGALVCGVGHWINCVIGSFEGTSGSVQLGAIKLTTGTNNLSTTFTGTISGTGGSLTKVGTGTLTLGGANTYTGGTIVNAGALLLQQTGTGSQTGPGNVNVNGGILGGNGIAAGNVTVGDARGPRGVLAPGDDFIRIEDLTVKKLTFRPDGIWSCDINSNSVTNDQVKARGVTIQPGATAIWGDDGTDLLQSGTTFIVINNTAPTPISGTFTGLPEGAIIPIGNNTYRVSYHGGTGNDMTLTVP